MCNLGGAEMILSFDLWHRGWGLSFTLIMWERYEDWLEKFAFEWQVKVFGRTFGGKEE